MQPPECPQFITIAVNTYRILLGAVIIKCQTLGFVNALHIEQLIFLKRIIILLKLLYKFSL